MMDWKDWRGKKIFVKLLTGDVYTGTCLDTDNSFLEIEDKFGDIVRVAISQIIKIVEENDGDTKR